MSPCVNNLSIKNGSINHQNGTVPTSESPSKSGGSKDEEEEYDEDEDVDFNPFLKEAASPAASSSLSSEIEALDGEIINAGEIVDNMVGIGLLKQPSEVQNNDGLGDSEIGEEETVMLNNIPSVRPAERELEKTLKRKCKRKIFDSATQVEGDNSRYKENTANCMVKVNGNEETELTHTIQSQIPTAKSNEEDAICMRTRARYSLASFTLDELEVFLQETDDEDDIQNVNDEEEYRKFLAAVLQGCEGDGQSIQQNENSDDDEDNDADFEIELEELLESDDEEGTADKVGIDKNNNTGRRPETRRNRQQKTSAQRKRNFPEQVKRPLHPLVPILPSGSIAPVDRRALMAENMAGDGLINGFSPPQLGQLHCLIHEHVQLLIQVFSLCVLDPARQHIATQVQGLISEMLHKREELIAWRNEPHCLVSGPVISVLDVAPLNLATRYMDDVSAAVRDYRRRQLESSCHVSCEREPLFPHPLTSLPEANCEVRVGNSPPASNTVQSSSSQQQSKKTLAATLVESAKKESVALVPKEISKLAQRFFPSFNSLLFPHRPPPYGVANRVLFTDAEDELLALGIMEYNSDWKAIQQRFLPCKSKHQIFVRQKNRSSSKAPENPIKAVRKMKSSPLTAEEIACIQEGLKYFKFDWMSVWKFIVPYRDPSLLPRQWRTALGVQKSYKQDAAKKEKRRLYELKRRSRAASANGQLASEKEDCHADGNEYYGGDDLMDNAGEAYVHEGFLADWRPGFSNLLSSEPLSSNNKEKDLPNNTPLRDGTDTRNTQLPTCNTDPFQGQQPSHPPNIGAHFSSMTVHRNPVTSDMNSTASRSQIYLRPYRARKSYNPHIVRLAPELPPVNLPPSVRVISQSSFVRNQLDPCSMGSAAQNRNSVVRRDSTVPQATHVSESGSAQLAKARDGKTDPLTDRVTDLCQEKSEVVKKTCVTGKRCNDPDLQMHPLLFQNTENAQMIYYSPSCATGASSSFSFFSEDRPQLLSLFNSPRQVNHAADHVQKAANSMEWNVASGNSGFHPLLQRVDEASSNIATPHANLNQSAGLEGRSCQLQNASGAVKKVSFSSKPSSSTEKPKEVDLGIHLSSTTAQEKGLIRDLAAKTIDTRSTCTSSHGQNKDNPAIFPERDTQESASPSNNISRFGMDEIGDQSNLGIVMEQEELSDSDEEMEENVEFECEEMADSEGEEGSGCEEIAEMQDKETESPVVERAGTNADSSDEQGLGDTQGNNSIPRTRSSSFPRPSLTELDRDSMSSPWLSLDSSRNLLSRNTRHTDKKTCKEPVAKNTLSCRPSRSCKKTTPVMKRFSESREVIGIAGLLSLGPLDVPMVKKPRKRVCRTNANLTAGTPPEISRPIDKDKSR